MGSINVWLELNKTITSSSHNSKAGLKSGEVAFVDQWKLSMLGFVRFSKTTMTALFPMMPWSSFILIIKHRVGCDALDETLMMDFKSGC